MSILKIYFDMDGVLADFDAGLAEITKRNDLNMTTDLMNEEQRRAKKEMWLEIERRPVWWHERDEMPGAREMLSKAHKIAGGNIFVLSKAPSAKNFIEKEKYQEFVRQAKKEWIAEHFPEFFPPENVIVMIGSKAELMKPGPNDILIDDRADNVEAWVREGGRGIVFKSAEQVIEELIGRRGG